MKRVFHVNRFRSLLATGLIAAGCAHGETLTNAPSKFRSPDDGWLDVSSFLDEKYGFLPVVLPITEPAVGYGAAAGLAFIDQPLGAAESGYGRPNVTMVGGMGTENGTWGSFIGDMLLLFTRVVAAQEPPASIPPASPPRPPAPEEPSNVGWEFSLSAYTYIVPDDREYVQPTITLDRGWLHLEARYNYENLDTGSLWFGYNFGGGDKVWWELTPMLGGVFGETTGVAPGYKGSLGWWKLELSTEGEFVIDTDDTSASFFYSWSELSLAPVDWLRVGLAGQRTRLYESARDYSGGLLAGVTFKRVNLTTYVFDLDRSKPLWVFGVGFDF